jgi:hypothetical protein
MAAKKPLVLDNSGELQNMQSGDFLDITLGGTGANTASTALTNLGGATSTALTAEVNRATSAESTLTTNVTTAQSTANSAVTAAAAAQATANAAVPQTTTVNGKALSANISISSSDVGLGNVNNTSDVNKPVSTAQATADATVLTNAKAYADSLVVGMWDDRGSFDASVNTYPTTGGHGISGAIVKGDIWTIGTVASAGPLLGFPTGSNVRAVIDNPGQTVANWATTEVGLGYTPENQANKSTSTALGTSDSLYPSQKAVKTYVDAETTARAAADTTLTTNLATEVTNRTNADALLVPKTTTINGHALNANVTVTAGDVGLGNVSNTSDANKSIGGNAATSNQVIESLVNNEAVTVAPGTPVYNDAAGTFKKANGAAALTAFVEGLANASTNAGASGNIATSGQLTLTTGQWDAITGQTGGLTPMAKYFLNTAVSGLLTSTVPTTGYLISIGRALSATTMSIRIGNKVQL